MIKNVGEISVNMKNKDNFFNEMHLENQVRGEYSNFMNWLKSQDLKALFNKEKELERIFRLSGITFNVYGQEEAEERLIPFDFQCYKKDSLNASNISRIYETNEYYQKISNNWGDALKEALDRLPDFPCDKANKNKI